MTSKEEKIDMGSATPPSPVHDHAQAHTKDTFTGDVEGVRDDFREDDFMTRNGLNLKSFQRRESHALSTAAN
jgi:amino acid transporter